MQTKFSQKIINVSEIELDLDNPRLFHRRLSGDIPQNEDELMEAIGADPSFKGLLKSIKKSGVKDPIWTIPQSNGKQLVIEGNRRVTCLKQLINSGVQAPDGVLFHSVIANVIDPDTSLKEIKLQKARLQVGKAAWGIFNVAALIYEFHEDELMAIEDIATEMQLSMREVNKHLQSYTKYLEYSKNTGDTNPKRFSMFYEMPKTVQEWIEESNQNKSDFHDWINPTSGKKARIRSVSTGGGLRDFSKVVEDNEALELMRTNPSITVEDALEVVKQNNVYKDMPFLNQLLTMASKINSMNENQKARVTTELKIQLHLASLRDACANLLKELETFESSEDK